uniref:Pre-mRNA-splicing factor 38 n=1 Tax=Oryza meridionalis TaxID=40149 RepID=A0A0E0E244_9ORYZ
MEIHPEVLLEKVLSVNIVSSDYFKELYRLKTYHEVINVIYNQVDHIEQWMTGNCCDPSSDFCLLYKFFTMKLTVKQMHGLLKHPDSLYIKLDNAGYRYFFYPRFMKIQLGCWGAYDPCVAYKGNKII